MDVYILNNQLHRDTIVDSFKSFIWTERFAAWGDFKMEIISTAANKTQLSIGTWLGIDKSRKIMMVETHEVNISDDGSRILEITGRSIEAILEDRVAKNSMTDLITEPKWPLSGLPMAIANKVFNDICVLGTLAEEDRIPYYTPGNLFPTDTNAAPDVSIDIEVEVTTVYGFLKELAGMHYFGFRLYRGPDTSTLYFNTYVGSDRTSTQTTHDPVIFSPALESLGGIKELKSAANYKNVAYVFSKYGYRLVYNEEEPEQVTGFNRRVLLVDANDIEVTAGLTLQDLLDRRGKEALAEHRQVSAFDGEIPEYGVYEYNKDYFMGDLVEMRNDDGMTNNVRVIEQIFISDSEGERSYPTVALDTFITPGAWSAWDFNKHWADYPKKTAGPGGIPPADPEAIWVWKKFEDDL